MRYGIIALLIGLLFLLVAELAGFASMRIVAVLLLAAGAVGIGIAAGREPGSVKPVPLITRIFSRTVFSLLAVILLMPVLAVLAVSVSSAAAQLLGSAAVAHLSLAGTGGVIGLLMLLLMVAALVIAIRAIHGNAAPHTGKEDT